MQHLQIDEASDRTLTERVPERESLGRERLDRTAIRPGRNNFFR